MIKILIRSWQVMLLLATFLITPSTAAIKPNLSAMDLNAYIHHKCKSKCINSKALLKVTKQEALTKGIDYRHLLAIITVESGFKPKARNQDSVGLMQVNLSYHSKSFHSSDPTNLRSNIRVGASIYKACYIKHKGNVFKALKCYNGEGRKTNVYSAKVLLAFKEISKLTDIEQIPMDQ